MTDPVSDRRLHLLSRHSLRPWRSLEEKRRCILCDRVFDATKVRIAKTRTGEALFHCPTRHCQAGPRMWVHPDDPLISPEAWNDWNRLIEAEAASESCDRESDVFVA